MTPQYPSTRLRRTRMKPWIRDLVRESLITGDDLIYPVFVVEGKSTIEEIPKMPGVYRFSPDCLLREVESSFFVG